MKENRTYRVGRGTGSDIMISESSVSRTHAELIATGDGRYYLNDCGSRYGTHVLHNGRWKAVRQVFVGKLDPIKFGEFETSVEELIEILAAGPGDEGDSEDPRVTQKQKARNQTQLARDIPDFDATGKADLPDGEVERDPETGEVIRKD